MLIVESQSLNVYRNLAAEEYLMEHRTGLGPVLFLWRSDSAVVIGKNQNPWRECRLDLMRAEEVPLARRISGGGAVYHDEGNLNYCVITDRIRYRKEQAYEMVRHALRSFGVNADQTGKSNLSVDGYKCSGNAFCFRKGRALHHGTLLLEACLDQMGRYLGPMFDQIDTRAIASEPAEVINLKLDMSKVSSALIESFQRLYAEGGEPVRMTDGELGEGIEPLLARQTSSAWKFDATPKFTLGRHAQRMEIEHGVVIAAEGRNAAFLGQTFAEVASSLVC